MNCGNEKCNYDLVDFEQENFICPKCQNIIKENLDKANNKAEIYASALLYRKKTRILKLTPLILSISALLMYFILSTLLYGFNGDILSYGFSTQGRMLVLPAMAMACLYVGTEMRSNIFRKLFRYKYIILFRIGVYRLVRIFLYMLISWYCLTKGKEELLNFISYAHYDYMPLNRLNLALKNIEIGYIFIIIYSLVAHIIVECIDVYIENIGFKVNKKLR